MGKPIEQQVDVELRLVLDVTDGDIEAAFIEYVGSVGLRQLAGGLTVIDT